MIGIIMLSAKDFIKAMDSIPITKAIASGILSKTDIIKKLEPSRLKNSSFRSQGAFSRHFQGFYRDFLKCRRRLA